MAARWSRLVAWFLSGRLPMKLFGRLINGPAQSSGRRGGPSQVMRVLAPTLSTAANLSRSPLEEENRSARPAAVSSRSRYRKLVSMQNEGRPNHRPARLLAAVKNLRGEPIPLVLKLIQPSL